MKNLITTLQNIYRIEELRNRIGLTLILLLIFRFGSYVALPGVNSLCLTERFGSLQGEGILGFLNTFVGGGFSRGTIFALGIMPYISASIIIQLLGAAVPAIQKLQKEGESGQKKLNQYTRYATVVITLGQSIGFVTNLLGTYPGCIASTAPMFWVSAVLILTGGTLFLVWLGERITDNGIGNGISLIIMIGIISELPGSLINEAQASGSILFFFIEIIALALVMMAVIALTQATRKIPVNYARRMVGNKIMGGMTTNARQYIPLKVNASGVMPIIFAQAIMFIPATVFQFFPDSSLSATAGSWFTDFTGVFYNLTFAFLIILFTYFYTAIAVNPSDIADQLKRNGGFIPGIKPGKKTSEFIDTVLSRITLPGSVFLAAVAIMPAMATLLGVSSGFAQFFGGTSLLIMIGVVLDTLQQIESYLLMRHYDGLMKTGRIKGRQSQVGVMA
ncbi:MAG: preprotein translocase subunit SecY [Sphingobacteriia bacterium]|jgi:preprotein translocase subunit SecY|nr:preprotein translocase subunit SecY [Sphingobacteriia bacterium]